MLFSTCPDALCRSAASFTCSSPQNQHQQSFLATFAMLAEIFTSLSRNFLGGLRGISLISSQEFPHCFLGISLDIFQECPVSFSRNFVEYFVGISALLPLSVPWRFPATHHTFSWHFPEFFIGNSMLLSGNLSQYFSRTCL